MNIWTSLYCNEIATNVIYRWAMHKALCCRSTFACATCFAHEQMVGKWPPKCVQICVMSQTVLGADFSNAVPDLTCYVVSPLVLPFSTKLGSKCFTNSLLKFYFAVFWWRISDAAACSSSVDFTWLSGWSVQVAVFQSRLRISKISITQELNIWFQYHF